MHTVDCINDEQTLALSGNVLMDHPTTSKVKSCALKPSRISHLALKNTWHASTLRRGCEIRTVSVQSASRHLV